MNTNQSADILCPVCGYNIEVLALSDSCNEIDTSRPHKGDASICLNCTSYLIFDDRIQLQVMTVDELVELDNDTLYELTSTRTALQKLHRLREELEHQKDPDDEPIIHIIQLQ